MKNTGSVINKIGTFAIIGLILFLVVSIIAAANS
jgi:large-conductance mechanosensitive channel